MKGSPGACLRNWREKFPVPDYEEVRDLEFRINAFEIQNGEDFAQMLEWDYPQTDSEIERLREYKDILIEIKKDVHRVKTGLLNKEQFFYDYKSLKGKIVSIIGNIGPEEDPGGYFRDLDNVLWENPIYTSLPYFETIYFKFKPVVNFTVTPVEKANCEFYFTVKRHDPKVCALVFEIEKRVSDCKFDIYASVAEDKNCQFEFETIKAEHKKCALNASGVAVLKKCGFKIDSIAAIASCGIKFEADVDQKKCIIGVGNSVKQICDAKLYH
ncbi:MAG: hypothetical protein E6Q68_02640 [Polynucleobacter sp.]|nr:MAG: hypothetical protein E6Q68_02640 [Polynucleobacter sp.]